MLLLLSLNLSSFGQDVPPPPPIEIESTSDNDVEFEETIVDFPDVEASFRGGTEAMQKYISKNVRYPQYAVNNNIEGKVYISFVVKKNGAIKHIRVERGAHATLNKEAVRLIAAMPKWKPGQNKGEKVATRCRVPINFVLE